MHNGQKEDVERTIKYFIHDGIVVRYNKIGFETKYYGSRGGLGTFEDRIKPGLEMSKKLAKMYPTYGKIKIRKNGMPEFVLARMPAKVSTMAMALSPPSANPIKPAKTKKCGQSRRKCNTRKINR
jgi:hypothetical protein